MSIPTARFTESLVETADWYRAMYSIPPPEDSVAHSEYIAHLISSNYPNAPPRQPQTSSQPSTLDQLAPLTHNPHTTATSTSSSLLTQSQTLPTPSSTATSTSLIPSTHHASSTDLIAQRMATTMSDSTHEDPFSDALKKPTYKLTRIIKGHEGWVTAVDVDVGNKLFATCSNDNTIKIWNLQTGVLLFTFTGHLLPINGVKFSHLHPRLFSASNDRDCKMWDLETNTFIHNLHGHKKAVNCVQLHPTLDVAVTGSTDTTIKVWDIRTKKPVRTLEGHREMVTSLVCLPTDPQIISSSLDTSIRLWDLGTGKTISTHTYHTKSVRKIITHPVEYTLISASSDSVKKWRLPVVSNIIHSQAAAWEVEQRQLIAALPPAQQIAKNPNNLKPCQESINASTLTLMTSFRGGLQPPTGNAVVNSMSLNNQNVLITARADGILDCYDYSTGKCYDSIQTAPIPGSLASEGMVCDICFDMSGEVFLTACADKTIKIYAAQR